MNTKVSKRWILFAAACILFVVIAIRDSTYIGSYSVYMYIPELLPGILFGEILRTGWMCIPTLVLGATLIASLIITSYNNRILAVIVGALFLVFCLFQANSLLCSNHRSYFLYYALATLLASAVLMVYSCSSNKPIWKKAYVVILILGVVLIAASIVLSFSVAFSDRFYFDSNVWSEYHNQLCEKSICFFPLEPCVYDRYRTTGTECFPISTGLLYFVLAAGINLPRRKISAKKGSAVSNEKKNPLDGYFDLMIHVLLCLFAGVVWQFVWVYRTTAYLNQETKEEHTPWKKLLLCIFIPFYWVYWFYINGKRLDQLAKDKGVHKGNITTICWVTALFLPIVSCVFMQERINSVCGKSNTDSKDKNLTEEIKELRALLDGGYITQEEFDAKKKQLLGL